jgi:hypothetical protein
VKSPQKWQWVPFIIGMLCLPGPPLDMLNRHWIQDYGLVNAILMELSTPEVFIVFPALALWYYFLAFWYYLDTPDDPNDKKPPQDTTQS